jgi:hypothetical protein
MQEYKRRQFRGHPPSLAEKSLRTEGFREALASGRSSAGRVGGDALYLLSTLVTTARPRRIQLWATEAKFRFRRRNRARPTFLRSGRSAR